MGVIEKSIALTSKDREGNQLLFLPYTKVDNVEGAVDKAQLQNYVTNQDLEGKGYLDTTTADEKYLAKVGKAESAKTADTVNWSGVQGRPTKLSQFTNDSGYLTEVPNVLYSANKKSNITINDMYIDLTSSGGTYNSKLNFASANNINEAGINLIVNGISRFSVKGNGTEFLDNTGKKKTTIVGDIITTTTINGTATKALQDNSGNVIIDTYATKEEIKGLLTESDLNNALDDYVPESALGTTVATLVDGKIPIEQLPETSSGSNVEELFNGVPSVSTSSLFSKYGMITINRNLSEFTEIEVIYNVFITDKLGNFLIRPYNTNFCLFAFLNSDASYMTNDIIVLEKNTDGGFNVLVYPMGDNFDDTNVKVLGVKE